MTGDGSAPARERFRTVWRVFRKDVRKRRRKLIAGMGFSLLLAVARVLQPWPLKIVFDQVLFHRTPHGWTTRIFLTFGSTPAHILTAASIALLLIGVVEGVAYYYQDWMLATAGQDIVYSVRARLYRHLLQLPMSFHVKRHVGDTLVRLSADIIVLRDVFIDFIVTLGAGAVMLVLMVCVMLLIDPVLTLVAFATMPVAFVITYVYGEQIRARSRKQRKREGEVGSLMHEALSAMSVVQLFGAEEREQERFTYANRRSLKQGGKTVRLEAQMNRAIQIALAFGMAVVLWVGSYRAINGHLSPGDLVVFISYLRAAYRPLRRGSKTVQRSAKALAGAERIAEVLAVPVVIEDAPDAEAAGPFQDAIRFQDVHFAYEGAPDAALKGVDLDFPLGAHIAIVGPSGSGKSTLLRMIPRLYDPIAGAVTFDGRDLRELTLESVRGQVSVVEQDAVLMGLSLADNIRYGRPDATDEEVAAAAEAAGLDGLIASLPEGLGTVVAERGASLSGGERQRVAIARAIVRSTPILLLDEPTTGLDPATKRGVIDALARLTEGRTAVVVTHDLELASAADEIVLLIAGTIRARGTYDELAASSEDFQHLARSLVEEAR